jgi:hypothetical protein
MKKLLLSLILSSSMLHCSVAFADTTNDEPNDDEQPSMVMAHPPAAAFEAAFAAHSQDEEQPCLMAQPPAVFEAAAALYPSAKLFQRHTASGLIPVGPEEGIVLGKTYYGISSSEEVPFEPISAETCQLLRNYYIDAVVFFEQIPGSPDKRKATLTVREGTEHERSINLFLSVITPQS